MIDYSPRDEWLSVAQAAPIIGVSPSKVRTLIWNREIAATQDVPGGKFRMRRSECYRYVAEIESRGLAALPA